ncbi:hypothetical protein F4859DRAFT_373429 [Xylaria cf. heliscus]|nr:hypothetical protein F4859DRAFT_373429 [Xylaria cf. heliscus]
MPCCGSADDYGAGDSNEEIHQFLTGNPNPAPRRPTREEMEKRQRQAQATAAAQRYGWPTSRAGIDHSQKPGNRDSLIEPGLASGLASMPGSDFSAVYDPSQPRRPRNPTPGPPRQTQQPPRPYYGQRVVNKQPVMMPPMMNTPSPANSRPRQPPARKALPMATQGPVMYKQPMTTPPIRTRPRQRPTQPEPARFSYMFDDRAKTPLSQSRRHRDFDEVSECSDTGDQSFRHWVVSPIASPQLR